MVGQSTRFFAPFMRQRQHYESGALGELATVEAAYNADHRWFLEKPWARQPAFKWLYGGISHPGRPRALVSARHRRGHGVRLSQQQRPCRRPGQPRHLSLRAQSRRRRIARVTGVYSCPTVPPERDSGMTCILRCDDGASQADYHELRYAWKIGDQAAIESFESKRDYYFRFGGVSHHAGEYQNYIEYFARCLEAGANAQARRPRGDRHRRAHAGDGRSRGDRHAGQDRRCA